MEDCQGGHHIFDFSLADHLQGFRLGFDQNLNWFNVFGVGCTQFFILRKEDIALIVTGAVVVIETCDMSEILTLPTNLLQ